MDISNIESVSKEFQSFKEEFAKKDKAVAIEKLFEFMDALEEETKVTKAAAFKDEEVFVNSVLTCDGIYISLNHVCEYYIFEYYFKPESTVLCTDIPYNEYYRILGNLCLETGRYKGAVKAFIRAVEWNPVDLDSYLGLAEGYKYTEKMDKYLKITQQAYRYCCTRATMARYYRNMGYYYLSRYNPELAKDCYIYSNIYYHTPNADGELKFIEEAMSGGAGCGSNVQTDRNKNSFSKNEEREGRETKPDIRRMQEVFRENKIEPGPSSDTIGIIYQVGNLLRDDGDYRLAKDCYEIVYDITGEEQLDMLIKELEKLIAREV